MSEAGPELKSETETHYHCACEECYWGTIVDSTDAAAAAVQEHEAKTDHAWVVRSITDDAEVEVAE